jgi:hypothetical protein
MGVVFSFFKCLQLTHLNLWKLSIHTTSQGPVTAAQESRQLSSTMADDESTTQSQSGSRSSTPSVSNPGTPRQELGAEVRATPPLIVPSPLTLQRSMPGPSTSASIPTPPPQHQLPSQSKYSSLLAVIEDMGRDIRPTYAGNRTSSERLKRSIVHARILVRECLMECERSART